MKYRLRTVDLVAMLVVWTVFVLLFAEHTVVGPLTILGCMIMIGSLFWFLVIVVLAMESEKIRPDLSGIPRSEM